MSSLLQQLENNEAILLMYLAGELPESDRVEVEQMLVNDPGLRALMSELAALQAEVTGTLQQADASAAALATPRREAAVRRTLRALDQARPTVATAADAAAPEAARRLRLPWWSYPIAAAAVLLVGIMYLSGRTPMVMPPSPQVDQQLAQASERDRPAPQPRILEVSPDPDLERLDDVEREVLSLRTPEANLFDPADTLDSDR